MQTSPAKANLSRSLFAAGLLAGAVAAAVQLVQREAAAALPAEAVARVDDRLILRDEWLKAVAATASERRTPLSEAEQQQILDRLIDEELLVQHGLQLGLVQRDRRLRGQLVSEVLFATTSAQAAAEPDDATLRRFYQEHAELFTPTAQLRVRAWRLDAQGERKPWSPALPDALLPAAKLQTYLGPQLTQAALQLPLHTASAPIHTEAAAAVLEVVERSASTQADFEQLRAQVLSTYRRRSDEAAVRSLLQQLRQSHDVQQATRE